MLVIGRKTGESIIIGDEIAITLTLIQGIQVKLGIEAPKDIRIYREELYDRMQRELV